MQDVRICFVGESFVNGTGDSTYLGWTGRVCQDAMQRGFPVTYYNLGIRRETSTELAKRWMPETARRFPPGCDHRLVFSFGTNDTTIEHGKRRVELSDSIANACQILSLAKQHPVLMISPPPIADREQNQRINALSHQFASICAEIEVPYLDVFTPLSSSRLWQQQVAAGDGAHPEAEGYAELAQRVIEWSAWQDWFES